MIQGSTPKTTKVETEEYQARNWDRRRARQPIEAWKAEGRKEIETFHEIEIDSGS